MSRHEDLERVMGVLKGQKENLQDIQEELGRLDAASISPVTIEKVWTALYEISVQARAAKQALQRDPFLLKD